MPTIGNLIINIAGNLDGLNDALSQGQEQVKNATGKMEKLGAVAKTGLAVGVTAGATALVAVGAGAAAAVGSVTNLASQIDQSQRDIQAGLGVTAQTADELGKIAQGVWKDNFTGSIEEATAAMITTRKQMKGLADNELQGVVEGAVAIQDVFGKDIAETTNSANALMENLGLTGQQSLDFIATGLQKGLDNSGDFLDSLGEYSNQFAGLGFSAEQMFAIYESGIQSGVLGTDKIGDAIKEFSIRVTEGGDDVGAAFKAAGLDFGELEYMVKSGQSTWADQFDTIIAGVNRIEDPVARRQAQIALFGTQAEDLGAAFTTGLTTATTTLEDMGGAVDGLNTKYDNIGSAVEGFKRTALLALTPIGDTLLDMANNAMPAIEDFFTRAEPILSDFATTFSETFTAALPLIEDAITRIAQVFGAAEDGAGGMDVALGLLKGTLDLVVTGVEALAVGLQLVADAFEAGKGLFDQLGQIADLTAGKSPGEITSTLIGNLAPEANPAIGQAAGFAADLASGRTDAILEQILGAIQSQETTVELDGEVVGRSVGQRIAGQIGNLLNVGSRGGL